MKKKRGFWSGIRWGAGVTAAVAITAAGSAPAPVTEAAQAPQPAPATVTETVTRTVAPRTSAAPTTSTPRTTSSPSRTTVTAAPVTETVVEMPRTCKAYLDLAHDVVDEIYAYEAAIAPQMGVMYDALGAIIDQDVNGLNGVITDQNSILNGSTGPLQRITGAKPELQEARADCLATLEEPR